MDIQLRTIVAAGAGLALVFALAGCDDKKKNDEDATDTVDDQPGDTTSDTTPEDTVGDTPGDTAGDTPEDTAGDTPEDTAGDTPEDTEPDVEPDTTPDMPMDPPEDWPTDLPEDWSAETSSACSAAGGFCSGARWVYCPIGYEHIAPGDPHRSCDMDGWCCVPAPYSPCTASGSATCVAGTACTGCWADDPAGLECEAGRVCCIDICD